MLLPRMSIHGLMTGVRATLPKHISDRDDHEEGAPAAAEMVTPCRRAEHRGGGATGRMPEPRRRQPPLLVRDGVPHDELRLYGGRDRQKIVRQHAAVAGVEHAPGTADGVGRAEGGGRHEVGAAWAPVEEGQHWGCGVELAKPAAEAGAGDEAAPGLADEGSADEARGRRRRTSSTSSSTRDPGGGPMVRPRRGGGRRSKGLVGEGR
jgi:hypothetical protein